MMMRKIIQRLIVAFFSLSLYYATISNEEQIIYLFSHGIADNHQQAFRYFKNLNLPDKPYIIPKSLVTFDYPCATSGRTRINRHHACLAQDEEVIHLANRFYSMVDPSSQAVLVGVSNGASCILNFMAWYRPETVRAIILESPFDSGHNIVHHFLNRARLSWIPGSHTAGTLLLCSVFKKYKSSGVQPIASAIEIAPQIPILFICSLEDKTVPAWSTMLVYAALRKTGHKNVYILVLAQGAHAKLIDDPIVGPVYQSVVHAFYRHYNLPHDAALANAGESIFRDCQPTVKELVETVPDKIRGKFKEWQ